MLFSARGNVIWVLPSRNKINATQLTVAAGFSRLRMGRSSSKLKHHFIGVQWETFGVCNGDVYQLRRRP